MTSKQRQRLLAFSVFMGIIILCIPLFFQDIEIIPNFWFTHSLPSTPHFPSPPTPDPLPLPKLLDKKMKVKEVFVIQLTHAKNIEEARSLVEKLKEQKFNAFLPLQPKNADVYIGPEIHYKEAFHLLHQLPPSLQQSARIETYMPS